MAETVGNEEDERAFRTWLEGWFQGRLGYTGELGPAWERYPTRAGELRTAYDAGMECGFKGRDCCVEFLMEEAKPRSADGGEDAKGAPL